jgi:exopolysaccharide biosynthesis polyprenyl glycosylphosphotransferase
VTEVADRLQATSKTRRTIAEPASVPAGAVEPVVEAGDDLVPGGRLHRRHPARLPLKPLLAVLDGVTITLAILTASGIRWAMRGALPLNGEQELWVGVLTVPAWIALFAANRLYSARHIARALEEFRRIARSTFLALVTVSAIAFAVKLDFSRAFLLIVSITTITMVTIERAIVRRMFLRLRWKGVLLRPVIVVGGNLEGLELCHMLETDRGLGYEVRGFVDDEAPLFATLHPHKGTVEQTIDAVRETGSTGVIIAATAMDLGTSNKLIRDLTELGIHVELSSTLRDIASHRLTVRPLGRFPVVYVEPVQRHGWRAAAKRALDLTLALGGLLALSPVLIATAIAVRLDSPGPILFSQTRVGRNGVTFKVHKFRSMVANAEALLIDLTEKNEADGPLFKMKDDPRVTKVGRFTRKFSIDELPQLWNVVKGEMSMVGPRPALPAEVASWGEALHGRLRVKPGVTGMWQVNGRSSSSFADYERLDLYYVDNWSLATDLAIVFKTIPSVILRKGAF